MTVTIDKKEEEWSKLKERIVKAEEAKRISEAQKEFGMILDKNIGEVKGKEKKPSSKIYTAYKYSKDIPLAEEIELESELDNKNIFLQVIDGEPIISEEIKIEKKNIIIKPNPRSETAPVISYTFKDIDEIRYFITQAQKETIHSLFSKSKSIWKYFVIAKDSDTITLLAIDQVYSYFQDLFATTHYIMVTGSPGSGKNAILSTMKALGYRVILASDMSGANLLDTMGFTEPCQVTIAEDELDDIDKDEIKKKLYKVGYDKGGMVPRTLDGNTSSRNNRWYYAFCFKIFAAENPLESNSLVGLNDRMFRIESIKSRPKFLIKTVLDQMQISEDKRKPKYKDIISKINYLRKLLLVYRLLHHNDIIEEVPLNIDGRALELMSPHIYLFASDELVAEQKPALNEVLKTLSRFLQKKGEITKKTIDGIVDEALEKELFPAMQASQVIDVNGRSTTTYTISNEAICDKVRNMVDGVPSTNPNEYAFYSTDYGKITHKRILKICRDRFSAEPIVIGSGNDRHRALVFDKETVEKVGKTFEIIPEIKITADEEGEEDNDDNTTVADDWNIPVSAPDPTLASFRLRSKENSQKHVQNEAVERKFTVFGRIRANGDKNTPIEQVSECENDTSKGNNDNALLSPENGVISAPSLQGNGNMFKCYWCDSFETNDETEYLKHGAQKHFQKPMFPNITDIEIYGLKPQGREWER